MFLSDLLAFLVLIDIVLLLIGMIRPGTLTVLFKRELSRGKIALLGIGLLVVLVFLEGVAVRSPSKSKHQASKTLQSTTTSANTHKPSPITSNPIGNTISHAPAQDSTGYPKLNKVSLTASIAPNNQGVTFTNYEKQQWNNCIATINPDSGSSNWYEYDFGSIPAGKSYTVKWSQLTREDGTRYTTYSKKEIIQLSCELDAHTIGFARLTPLGQ